jgi:hypothetical protein
MLRLSASSGYRRVIRPITHVIASLSVSLRVVRCQLHARVSCSCEFATLILSPTACFAETYFYLPNSMLQASA